MNWQVVELRSVLPGPWKNGAGSTRELVAWPGPGNWAWRMSVAEVSGSGPFSRFEGVQRWFAVLCGAGVVLTTAGRPQALTMHSAPYCFDGAVPTDCALVDGATRDFNLMTRCAGTPVTGARMARVCGSARVAVVGPGIVAVYAVGAGAKLLREQRRLADPGLDLPPDSLAWRSVEPGERLQVQAEQALLIEIDLRALAEVPAHGAAEQRA